MDAKDELKEIFRFWEYKLDNNLCTPEEIESAKNAFMDNMEMHGTISDFAKFYGVSEGNVRTAINRKLLAKGVMIRNSSLGFSAEGFIYDKDGVLLAEGKGRYLKLPPEKISSGAHADEEMCYDVKDGVTEINFPLI